jgi:hypothetical protein
MRNVLETFLARCRPCQGFKTLYTAKGGEIVRFIAIANVNGVNSTYSICLAQGPESYGKKNALVWNEVITANDNDTYGYGIPLSQGMRIGVHSSSEKALNFTVYGAFGDLGGLWW